MKNLLFNFILGQANFATNHSQMMNELKLALFLFIFASLAFVIGMFVYKKLFYTLSFASFIGCFYLCYLHSDFEIVWLFVSLMGVLMLAMEILVPGVQVFGFVGAGLIALGLSNMLGSIELAIFTVGLSVLLAIVTIYIFTKKGYRVKSLQKFVLKDDIKSKATPDRESLVGKEGITTSALRPTGKGVIEDKVYDLYSEADFIPAQTEVVVVGESNNKIIVRRKTL